MMQRQIREGRRRGYWLLGEAVEECGDGDEGWMVGRSARLEAAS